METGPDYIEGNEGALTGEAEQIEMSAQGGEGERLDRFLASRLPGVSRSRIQQWIALGAVSCEQRALAAKTRLTGIEQIRVTMLPREADHAFEPDPVPLTVVHEDEALLVIDKPAGLVTHPAPGHWRGTLLNGLLHLRPALSQLPRAGIVHRLDKDTSGLLVVGKSEAACAALVGQLADRSMSRRYLAFVQGQLAAEGDIDASIGRDPRQRTRMAVVPGPAGKPASTHFTRLADSDGVSLAGCRLRTGRTHQIRVHLSSIGHPLLGDDLYGGSVRWIARQALHATALGLVHPLSGQQCRWESPLPADLAVLARQVLPDAASGRLQGQVREWLDSGAQA